MPGALKASQPRGREVQFGQGISGGLPHEGAPDVWATR
jgi:hypothetical protein